MTSKINYHIHSNYSDGAHSITELMGYLSDAGIEEFAITDHDMVIGNYEAQELSASYGLRCVNGIELSCCFDGELGLDKEYICHILGLGIDNLIMKKQLEESRARKNSLMSELIEKLISKGYTINKMQLMEIKKLKKRHFVTQLRRKCNSNTRDTNILDNPEYEKYFYSKPTIIEGIKMIRKAGGKVIMAHPYNPTNITKQTLNDTQVSALLDYYYNNNYDIDGIEAYYQNYTKEQINLLIAKTIQYNWKTTVGTDLHRLVSPLWKEKISIKHSKIQKIAFDICEINQDILLEI